MPVPVTVGLLLAAAAAGACSSSGSTSSSNESPGRLVAEQKGCLSCHSTDGTRLAGPSWSGLAGSTVSLADGRSVVADDAYLRRSITEPGAEVVEGFAAAMPKTSLSPTEIDQLVTYIASLGPGPGASTVGPGTGTRR